MIGMARQRIGGSDRARDALIIVGLQPGRDPGIERAAPVKDIMPDIGLQRRFQRRHPDEPQILQLLGLVPQAQEAGVVALVVGDHQDDPGAFGRRNHLLALRHGKAHRLFDEHMDTTLGRRDGDGCMAAGGQDQHGIELLAQQLLPAPEGLLDPVIPGAGLAHAFIEIAERDNFIAIG